MKYIFFIILMLYSYGLLCQNHIGVVESNASQKLLKISLKVSDATIADSFRVSIYTTFYPILDSIPFKYTLACLSQDGFFHFSIPINAKMGYFSVQKLLPPALSGNRPDNAIAIVPINYWEAGDNITISLTKKKDYNVMQDANLFNNYDIAFTGNGSFKYEINAEAQKLFFRKRDLSRLPYDSQWIYHDCDQLACDSAVALIQRNKSQLTLSAFNILKADFLFQDGEYRFGNIESFYRKRIVSLPNQQRQKFRSTVLTHIGESYTGCKIQDRYLEQSREFSNFAIHEQEALFYINSDSIIIRVNQDSIYNGLKRMYTGSLRDKLLEQLFSIALYFGSSTDSTLRDAIGIVNVKEYRSKLEGLYQTRAIGRPAFNFNLMDTSGSEVSFNTFKGKTVLLDFYFNGCGACQEYYKNVLQPVEEHFKSETNMAFISISADANMNNFKSGLISGKYVGNRGISLYTNGKGYLHPIIYYYGIIWYPTAILIGPNGRIARFNSSDLYQIASLEETINSLSYN